MSDHDNIRTGFLPDAGESGADTGFIAGASAAPDPHAESLLAECERLAGRYFGYQELRPRQREVLRHILSDRDTLAVLPTGSGKTLCFALPALVRPGLVLVVSPLIALMRDQLRRLDDSGIAAVSLDSHQTGDERDDAWQRMVSGQVRVVMVSPERLARVDFRERLARLPVQMVAVDEAHCISQWGSHFRPEYRQIGEYIDALGSVQKVALTATATRLIREDICRSFGLESPATVIAESVRDNLRLRVVRTGKVTDQLTALLNAVLSSRGHGIVYASTRNSVRDIARMLHDAGVQTAFYHGGMVPEQRRQTHQLFVSGAVRVVVATNAFGMGIDKGDIRFVHHAGLPASVEQYVQEVGRAGRDGEPAVCDLIFNARDYHIQKFMIEKSFPADQQVRQVFEAAQPLLDGGAPITWGQLIRVVSGRTDLGADEIREIVTVLCREGVFSELRAAGNQEWQEPLITGGSAALATGFFASYAGRRSDALNRLDQMRAYAGLASGHQDWLDAYFLR